MKRYLEAGEVLYAQVYRHMQLYYLYVYVVDDDLKIDDDIKYKR